MFVTNGAGTRLLETERLKFLAEQWPQIRATIQRLGFTPQELMTTSGAPAPGKEG